MNNKSIEIITNRSRNFGIYALKIFKWIVIGLVVGLLVGAVSTVFSFCLSHVTELRNNHSWIVYGLPIGGLVIVGFYKLLKVDKDKGTNLVMTSISENDEVPFKVAPLIFVSTIITHLFGGSAGREGAALQLGGSLGNMFGKIFKFDEKDKKVVIMCGMSAAFAALFGTPMAAAVFAIEAATVGIMYYSSLLPCVVAALVASRFSATMGISPESFPVMNIPDMDVLLAVKSLGLALLCGLLSILFCLMMKYVKKFLEHFFKNPFVRVVVAALVFVGITAIVGTTDYFGAGTDVIDRAVIEGEVVPYSFILKMFLTALTLGAGFKGGEIVPTFYVGATFGCLFGQIVGMPPTLSAAMGMTAVFCGVTNCPVSAMLISFELFGFDCVPYILIATAVSFVSSGYYGIYSGQKIMYSKYKPLLRNEHNPGNK